MISIILKTNNMGNCCGAENHREKEISMARDYHGTRIPPSFDHLFDNREIMGLRGKDKIYLIIRL